MHVKSPPRCFFRFFFLSCFFKGPLSIPLTIIKISLGNGMRSSSGWFFSIQHVSGNVCLAFRLIALLYPLIHKCYPKSPWCLASHRDVASSFIFKTNSLLIYNEFDTYAHFHIFTKTHYFRPTIHEKIFFNFCR